MNKLIDIGIKPCHPSVVEMLFICPWFGIFISVLVSILIAIIFNFLEIDIRRADTFDILIYAFFYCLYTLIFRQGLFERVSFFKSFHSFSKFASSIFMFV